jgi:hypothetical protein
VARQTIDAALVAGTPNRRIAAQYAVSEQAIRRHRAEHLPEKLARAEQAAEVAEATDLLREVRALRSKAYGLLLRAEREGDLRTALQGVREARGCLELLAELEGELDKRASVNVVVSGPYDTATKPPFDYATYQREFLALMGAGPAQAVLSGATESDHDESM